MRASDVRVEVPLPAKILRIAFGEALPLLGQIIEGKNGGNRADRYASAAVDALHRIDVEHLFLRKRRRVLLGVNAIDRARIHTSRILGSNARFCNHISHKGPCLPDMSGIIRTQYFSKNIVSGIANLLCRHQLSLLTRLIFHNVPRHRARRHGERTRQIHLAGSAASGKIPVLGADYYLIRSG
jgi:hypothetical protein